MIKFIKQVFPKDRIYYVAVSMGADSVAALLWMHWMGYKALPLHFNHGLRPQNNAMQRRFTELCVDFGLDGRIGQGEGLSTEAECRAARLNFYSKEAAGGHVVTAHHLDDWVESYLLNCFRGHPDHEPFELESVFPEFSIVHPFLVTKKRDFLQFLKRNNYLKYVVQDETNGVVKGSRRNWVRHSILPEMESQKLSLDKYARRRIGSLTKRGLSGSMQAVANI